MNTQFLPRWKHPAAVCSKNPHKLLLRKGGSMGEADTAQTHTNPPSLSPFATDAHPRNYLTYASLSLKWAVRQGCNPHKVWKGTGQEGTKRHFKPGNACMIHLISRHQKPFHLCSLFHCQQLSCCWAPLPWQAGLTSPLTKAWQGNVCTVLKNMQSAIRSPQCSYFRDYWISILLQEIYALR